MDTPGFRTFLEERKLSADQIDGYLAIAHRFDDFLATTGGGPSAQSATAFSPVMIDEELNDWPNFHALLLYARFMQNDDLYIGFMELVDGAEALHGLYDRVGEVLGEEKRDDVFDGLEVLPYGSPTAVRPSAMQAFMTRLESRVAADTCYQILSGGLRYLEDGWFLDAKTKYEAAKDVDDYLDTKGQEFLAELEKHNREGSLFFTQRISDEALDWVRRHPEVYRGERKGNVVYEVKIPYMTGEYLTAGDARMKRYYYCHCPWVREGLRTGEVEVSPTFCQCSAGFHKRSWQVIFGQPLEAEVVESVLKGDPWCKIAIHLPDHAFPES